MEGKSERGGPIADPGRGADDEERPLAVGGLRPPRLPGGFRPPTAGLGRRFLFQGSGTKDAKILHAIRRCSMAEKVLVCVAWPYANGPLHLLSLIHI